MMPFGNAQPAALEPWRVQLDRLATTHQQELAALAWGLSLNKQVGEDVLGIDLKPTPHFVYCSRSSLETLNKTVGGQLQEILGLVDGHDHQNC